MIKDCFSSEGAVNFPPQQRHSHSITQTCPDPNIQQHPQILPHTPQTHTPSHRATATQTHSLTATGRHTQTQPHSHSDTYTKQQNTHTATDTLKPIQGNRHAETYTRTDIDTYLHTHTKQDTFKPIPTFIHTYTEQQTHPNPHPHSQISIPTHQLSHPADIHTSQISQM